MSIPHVIHYCWFGGSQLPPDAERCIASWRKFFPGWEIKRWDESNYNVRAIPYTAQAYDRHKYAFVSDYARFDILYREGGVYLDTDVEVIRPFDDIVARGAFMGMEGAMVNPGLGMGAESGHKLYAEILDKYAAMPFVDADGRQLPGTVVKHTTDILATHGYRTDRFMQNVDDITIYPPEFFCPLDDLTGRLHVTPETRSIHHYAKSWCEGVTPWRTRLSRWSHRVVGFKLSARIKNLLKL
ncbi:MAG: glycosyl transferase [Muribaculaceae bacterium]|nr:glycosyl transferase [Muribaculaceae bacterium]